MRINSATQSNQTSAASAPRRASAAGTFTLEETGTAGKAATLRRVHREAYERVVAELGAYSDRELNADLRIGQGLVEALAARLSDEHERREGQAEVAREGPEDLAPALPRRGRRDDDHARLVAHDDEQRVRLRDVLVPEAGVRPERLEQAGERIATERGASGGDGWLLHVSPGQSTLRGRGSAGAVSASPPPFADSARRAARSFASRPSSASRFS